MKASTAIPGTGQGIGLVTRILAQDEIRAGRLVQAFDAQIDIGHGFYLLSGQRDGQKPASLAFRQWLLEEIAMP